MEELKVNEKVYVLKDDIENEYKRRMSETKMADIHLYEVDNTNVMALGSVKLEGDWKASKISISYLEKAIQILKMMGEESITIAWTTERPVCLGQMKNRVISGVVIAPRVDND